MDISKEEKMRLLLKQLEVSEDIIEKHFQNSELDKLEVYKQTKTWHFHLKVKRILPLHIYQLITAKLQESFQQIATVDLSLKTEEKDCEDATICDYWHSFIQSISNISPAYKDLVHNHTPQVNNNKLMLTVRNEAEGAALKTRLEDPTRIYCRKIGAPNDLIDVVVKTEEADIQKLREQKAIEDQQLILKTVQEKEKRDQNKLRNDQNKPLMLGYNIKDEPMQMEEIQDEERSEEHTSELQSRGHLVCRLLLE